MKLHKLFLLLLVGAVLISACQLGQPQKTEMPAAPQEYPAPAQGYPQPQTGGAYPYPGAGQGITAPTGGSIYPDFQDGQEIFTAQVAALIMNGEVEKVVIGAGLKVFLTLKDGRVFTFVQSVEGEVLEYIKACGDPCKDINVSNE